MKKNIFKRMFWKIFIRIDAKLKFSNLKPNKIGIQLGFDMSAPVTSDLFLMSKFQKNKGLVIGIDPDPENNLFAQKIIDTQKLNIKLIQKAVFSEKGKTILKIAKKASWNQIERVKISEFHLFTDKEIEVELDTLDNIISENNIDIQDIDVINITINGAEFDSLKGMKNILEKAENLFIIVVAGRSEKTGTINGKADYKVITDYLKSFGFVTSFKRKSDFFWWGFIISKMMKRQKLDKKNNYGVVFASKGNKKIKWFQSFS